ncbi:MAG: ABC transporter ATP-binding protein [Clostridia bacterium]|nr:ABC transporter ATP-binding protein [Clostridia bacterium]
MKKTKQKGPGIRHLKPCVKGYVLPSVMTPVLIIFEVALEVVIPLLMAALVDGGLYRRENYQLKGLISRLPYQNNLQFILWVGGLMALASLLSLLCGALAARTSAVASMGFAKNLREKIFSKILSFSFKNTDKFRTSSLVMRVTTDVNNMQNTYQQIIRIMVRAPIMMVLAAVMAFRINVELSFIFVVAIPLILVPMLILVLIGHKRFRRMLKKYDAMNGAVQENLIGARVVKSFVREPYEKEKFQTSADDLMKTQIYAQKLFSLSNPIQLAVMWGATIVLLLLGGQRVTTPQKIVAGTQIEYRVVVTNNGEETLSGITIEDSLMPEDEKHAFSLEPGQSNTISYLYTVTAQDEAAGTTDRSVRVTGTLTDGSKAGEDVLTVTKTEFGGLGIGELTSMMSYSTQVISSLTMVSMIIIMLSLTRASLDRINEVFEETIDIDSPESDLVVKTGEIEFDHVDFSYSNNPEVLNLKDINLRIQAGQTVGIIGGTGEGKSTLVQMIPRLYDVLAGSVRVSGHDVREYGLTALRDGVSMVLQKNMLFSGSIRENMRWGDPSATDEQIREACRVACADDFVMAFPDGYDTDLGQGGCNVSGGQKQRLCIARALLKKPKILILDDSTSAVDTATEARIREGLKNLRDMTKIIIAQRIGSIINADQIVVMEHGAISDVGTHAELMQRCGIYREVYESQVREEANA